MKTTIVSLFAATLLGFAFFASGRLFDAADFVAITFAVGLVAWTVGQYSREPRVLTGDRPIHLPVNPRAGKSAKAECRMAA